MSLSFPPASSYPPYVQNLLPARAFNHWRMALNNVRNGTSAARIFCAGDSTTAGFGSSTQSTVPNTNSFPTRLASLINSAVTSAAPGLVVPPSDLSGSTDTRWTVGSGWSRNTFGAGGGACFTGGAGSGSLVYAPGQSCNAFYVYFLGHSSNGTLTCTATGGSAVTIASNSYADGVYRQIVSAGSISPSNTLTMTATVSNCHVVGIEPVLTASNQILIGNAGVGSSTTTGWCANPSTFGAIPLIKTHAPDLTIISLGINDATAALAPASYIANLQSLITAAKISGDVILCDMPPTQTAATYNAELTYLGPLAALAAANNCPYLSVFSRFGGSYNSNFMYGDGTHGNDQGYWDWAQALANLILT